MNVLESNWVSDMIKRENRAREAWERKRNAEAYAAAQPPEQAVVITNPQTQTNIQLPPVSLVNSSLKYQARIEPTLMPPAGARHVEGDHVNIAWDSEPAPVTLKPGQVDPRLARTWVPVNSLSYVQTPGGSLKPTQAWANVFPVQPVTTTTATTPVPVSVATQSQSASTSSIPVSTYAGPVVDPVATAVQTNLATVQPATVVQPMAQVPVQYPSTETSQAIAATRMTVEQHQKYQVPVYRDVQVPVTRQHVVTTLVPQTVTTTKLVPCVQEQDVQECYVDQSNPTAPICRSRVVRVPLSSVQPQEVSQTVLVPKQEIAARTEYIPQRIPDPRVVDVVDVVQRQDYDVVPVPVGPPRKVGERVVARMPAGRMATYTPEQVQYMSQLQQQQQAPQALHPQQYVYPPEQPPQYQHEYASTVAPTTTVPAPAPVAVCPSVPPAGIVVADYVTPCGPTKPSEYGCLPPTRVHGTYATEYRDNYKNYVKKTGLGFIPQPTRSVCGCVPGTCSGHCIPIQPVPVGAPVVAAVPASGVVPAPTGTQYTVACPAPVTAPLAPCGDHSLIGVVLKASPRGLITVEGVRRGSPAERAGLLPGDTVIAIQGVAVRDLATVRSTIHNHCAQYPITRACRPLTFLVKRGKKQVHISVQWEK